MNQPTYNEARLPNDRIQSLDLLRGIAVLGILIMNIQSFAMISAAYSNPFAFGELSGIHKVVWWFNQLVASEKFINIFSMLFGAGVILLYERKKQQGAHPWKVQLRRNFWLFFFGLTHAYLIWYGDILVTYSLCGVFVFLFRDFSSKKLFWIAGAFFLVPVLLALQQYSEVRDWTSSVVHANLMAWQPSPDHVTKEVAAVHGSYIELIKHWLPILKYEHTQHFAKFYFWRVSAMMFLGMALYKTGVLTASKPAVFYKRLIFIGLPLGMLLSIVGIRQNYEHQWAMEYSMIVGYLYNLFGSIPSSLAYIGIVMLIAISTRMAGFKASMTSTGKMAFTNYILTSILCGFIFYGYGLGLFGKLERFGQFMVVIGVWSLLILFSTLWLKRFYYGPLEWLWRYLTYGKKPPFRR
ncbi:MAG: DUF418 domain-containing protein [Bacteroidota bacterium]|nr:MAG: DUF418 domain-containing protein [Bacteroidota bacterium]